MSFLCFLSALRTWVLWWYVRLCCASALRYVCLCVWFLLCNGPIKICASLLCFFFVICVCRLAYTPYANTREDKHKYVSSHMFGIDQIPFLFLFIFLKRKVVNHYNGKTLKKSIITWWHVYVFFLTCWYYIFVTCFALNSEYVLSIFIS